MSPISRCCWTVANPIISTSIFHVPGGMFENTKFPDSSVEVEIWRSPCLAVTVAPGMARPPDLTEPR